MTQPRGPNCLTNIHIEASVFDELCHTTVHEAELHDIAIINKTSALAWSLEAGYIFFDERLHIPAAPPLLPALIDALLSGRRVHNHNYLEL